MRFDLFQGRLGKHRFHPMLVHFPTGLYPFSLVADISRTMTQNDSFYVAGLYALYGAVGMSVPAMLYGVIDFLKIETTNAAWKKAGLHALLNLLWLMIFCTLLFYRIKHLNVGTVYISVSALSTAGLFYSNYLGADLIISHRIGIDPHVDHESKSK